MMQQFRLEELAANNGLLNGQMVLGWLVEKIKASGKSKKDLRDVLDKWFSVIVFF